MARKISSKEPKTEAPPVSSPARKSEVKEDVKAPELSTLNSWYDFASESARKKHWDFFVIDQFLRGNHNVRGNPQDNTIVVTQRADQINYPINKMFSTFRAVRAFVTRHKPKVEVEPTSADPQAKDYARKANKVLERDNALNNFRKINKEWVYYGVKYGVGYRQIGYDVDKKVCTRWTIDPFDLVIGSKTGNIEDAPYVIKTVVRTIGYLKEKYPKKDISPDNEIAADEYKRLSLQVTYPDNTQNNNTEDEQTAIVKECWYRVFKKNKYGGLVNKCIFTENEILSFEETPYEEYPFIPYYSEVTPNDLYPDGHMKHVISPQRMLNLLESQLLEYNHIVNRGRFLKDKNAGFRVIYAKEGQIIEHNAGKRVEVLNPPGINPALPEQIKHANDYIDEIGGSSDASRGIAPYSGASGEAIKNLQTGDSNNISDLRDNFEDALAKEAAWILKMYSLFEKDGVVLTDDDTETNFAAVGQVASEMIGKKPKNGQYFMEDNGGYYDAFSILPDNNVKVSVTSELGETKSERRELLFRLVEAGLPLKTLLEYLEFPNVDQISQRIAEEALAEVAMNQMQAPPQEIDPEAQAMDGQIEQELQSLVGE